MTNRTLLVERFFSGTGTQYDRIADLCTLGFDSRWKKRILERIPAGSARILDQACGTGILTFDIARAFPASRITGVELRDEYLRVARRKARELGVRRVDFVLGRAEDVHLDEPVDCVTSSYLAKYAELDPLVRNIGRMLRPGGTLIMHDFTYPSARIYAAVWELHFKLLQTLGSAVYPQWKTAFDELPGLLRQTHWVDELVRCLARHRFTNIEVEPLTFGAAAIVAARSAVTGH